MNQRRLLRPLKKQLFSDPLIFPPPRDCVVIGEMEENVMLNLFQHLMESISYETLKRVQGDKNELRHSPPLERGGR